MLKNYLRRKAEFTFQYNQQFIAFLCNFSLHLSRHMLSWAIWEARAVAELFGFGSMGREGKKYSSS